MRAVRADLGAALQENRQQAEQLRAAHRDLARLRKAQRGPAAPEPCPRTRRERFNDDKPWLRHELLLAWVERVDPNEREQYPMRPDYVVGPALAASLDQLDDDRLEKALRAAIDVLTGRVDSIASRRVHPLRTRESGGAPDVSARTAPAACAARSRTRRPPPAACTGGAYATAASS